MTPQQAVPALIDKPDGSITFWVIYDHPKDFPNGFVLRPQFAVNGRVEISPLAWYADDPEKLRAIMPPCCVLFERSEGDDPAILESWME